MIRTRARSVVASATSPDAPQGAVVASGQLPAIVERIEKLEADRSATSADIRDMYAEAKGQGYNVKALRGVVRERRQDAGERAELEATMDAYRAQLGMVARAVGNGEMSIRQAEEVSGFSRSAIHREVSHRKNIAVSGTADAPAATATAADEGSFGQWDTRHAVGGWRRRPDLPGLPEARAAITLSSGRYDWLDCR